MSSPYSLKQRFVLAIVPPLAAFSIRALGSTLRYEEVVATHAKAPDDFPEPSIYAFWHRSLLLAVYRFRSRKIAILVSRSFDGELIARTAERLGFHAIRGSSTRGGPTALRQLAEAYRQGYLCAMTVDGPRGPAQVAKPGPVQLAELVDATEIGTFYVLPENAWVLKTWDKLLVPKPFSRVRLTVPNPVAPTLTQLQSGLDEAVRMAELQLRPGFTVFERGQASN